MEKIKKHKQKTSSRTMEIAFLRKYPSLGTRRWTSSSCTHKLEQKIWASHAPTTRGNFYGRSFIYGHGPGGTENS